MIVRLVPPAGGRGPEASPRWTLTAAASGAALGCGGALGAPETVPLPPYLAVARVVPETTPDAEVVDLLVTFALRRLAEQRHVCLTFLGESGTGKSALCRRLIRALLERVQALVREARATRPPSGPAGPPGALPRAASAAPSGVSNAPLARRRSQGERLAADGPPRRFELLTLTPADGGGKSGGRFMQFRRLAPTTGVPGRRASAGTNILGKFTPRQLRSSSLDLSSAPEEFAARTPRDEPPESAPPAKASSSTTHPGKKQPVVFLPNNGRRGRCPVAEFGAAGGAASYARLPPLPTLPHALAQAFQLEFWVKTERTDAPMAPIAITDAETQQATLAVFLNWSAEKAHAPGHLLFYLRDAIGRELAAQSTRSVCDGQWHHIRWLVKATADNDTQVFVDGVRLGQLSVGPAEGPVAVPRAWAQWGCLGAALHHVEPSGIVHTTKQFCGCLAEVRLWGGAGGALLAHWSLDEARGTRLQDRGPAHLPATAHNLAWIETEFPDTALYFDGANTYVDVGPLGTFGQHLRQCSVDLWFCTAEAGLPMSLVSVMDSAQRHVLLAVQLNTDPTGRYQRSNACVQVRDRRGAELCATFVCPTVFDQQWHHLVVRVQHAPGNELAVLLDEAEVSLLYHCQDGPSDFGPFTETVLLGAAAAGEGAGGRRGGFRGFLRHVRVSHGAQLVAHWPLAEGPGARVLMDVSGHCHHGVPHVGKVIASHWLPVSLPWHLAYHEPQPTPSPPDASQGTPPPPPPPLFRGDPAGRLAWVDVVTAAGGSGPGQEALWDALHGRALPPLPSGPMPPDGHRGPPADSLPEGCWAAAPADELLPLYLRAVGQPPSGRGATELPRHSVVLLQLPDAHLTLIDAYTPPRGARAAFDPGSRQWTAPLASFGAETKALACLGRGAAALQEVVGDVGFVPQLFRPRLRAAHQHTAPASQLCAVALRALSPNGAHTAACVVLCCPAVCSAAVGLSVQACIGRLGGQTQWWAAVRIQACWRCRCAQRRAAALRRAVEGQRARQQRRATLLAQCPEKAQAKVRRVAVLVEVQRVLGEGWPAQGKPTADSPALAEALQRWGFTVTVLATGRPPEQRPTRANVLRAIAAAKAQDALLWVQFIGPGTLGWPYSGPSQADLAVERAAQEAELDRVAAAEERGAALALKRARLEERVREHRRVAADLAPALSPPTPPAEADAEWAAKPAIVQRRLSGSRRSSSDTPLLQTPRPRRRSLNPALTSPGESDEAWRRKQQEVLQHEAERLHREEVAIVAEEAQLAADLQRRPVPAAPSRGPQGAPRWFCCLEDTPLEFSDGGVLYLDDLQLLVLGEASTLGQQAVLVTDLTPLPQAAWWWPAAPLSGPEALFEVRASDGQAVLCRLPPRCAGLGSFHVRKYFTHRPAADLPPASLPGADVERLLGYLAAKLGKQPGAHLDRRTVDHPEWDFVGDLQLGRRPPPPTPGLSVPFTLSLWVEGQTSALHPADGARLFAETVAVATQPRSNHGRPRTPPSSEELQLRWHRPLPAVRFTLQGSLPDALREPQRRRWPAAVRDLCAGHAPAAGTAHRLVLAGPGAFALEVAALPPDADHLPLLRALRTHGMDAAARLAGFRVLRFEQRYAFGGRCSPAAWQRLDRSVRQPEPWGDGITVDLLAVCTEEEARGWEAAGRALKEQNMQAQEPCGPHLSPQQLQAMEVKMMDLRRCAEITPEDFALLFPLPAPADLIGRSLAFCTAWADTEDRLRSLAEAGLPDVLCRALAIHLTHWPVVAPALRLIARVASLPPPQVVPRYSRRRAVMHRDPRPALVAGGAVLLIGALLTRSPLQDVAEAACSALAPLCQEQAGAVQAVQCGVPGWLVEMPHGPLLTQLVVLGALVPSCEPPLQQRIGCVALRALEEPAAVRCAALEALRCCAAVGGRLRQWLAEEAGPRILRATADVPPPLRRGVLRGAVAVLEGLLPALPALGPGGEAHMVEICVEVLAEHNRPADDSVTEAALRLLDCLEGSLGS